jgi:hypothetical protein
VSAYHLNNEPALDLVWAIMQLDFATFNHVVFVLDITGSAFEYWQESLLQCQKAAIEKRAATNNTYFDIYLEGQLLRRISFRNGSNAPWGERIVREEGQTIKDEGSVGSLRQIESREPELSISVYRLRWSLENAVEVGVAYKVILCFNRDTITELRHTYKHIMKPE